MNNKITCELAAAATFGTLYNEQKSDVYDIIAKFVEHIIISENKYQISLDEIDQILKKEYNFKIPLSILKTAINRLKYLNKSYNLYFINSLDVKYINAKEVKNEFFKKFQEECNLVKKLEEEVIKKKIEHKLGSVDDFIKEFTNYVLYGNSNSKNELIINSFITSQENNDNMKKLLLHIKEGIIFNLALMYNDGSVNPQKWKEKLVIYIETEIIFDLAGYNGELHKRISNEFINLVNEMNAKKADSKRIEIRYFDGVETEINMFFKKAEDIIRNKDVLRPDNVAMCTIVNGCIEPIDILKKKTDLLRILSAKNIHKADDYNFFIESNRQYNLDDITLRQKYELEDSEDDLKHVNYVNILRKNQPVNVLSRSGYIVLSETRKILNMAKELAGENVPLAVDLRLITNKLWFDLNKGIVKDDSLLSTDIIIRSKIILSNLFNRSLGEAFDKILLTYKSGEISEDILKEHVSQIRKEIKTPDDIESHDSDNIYDCITEGVLRHYSIEKDKIVENNNKLQKDNEKLEQQNLNQRNVIDEQEKYIKSLESKEAYHESNEQILQKFVQREEKNKEKADKICKWIVNMLLFVMVILIMATVFYVRKYLIEIDFLDDMEFIIGIVVLFLLPTIDVIMTRKLNLEELKTVYYNILLKVKYVLENRIRKQIYSFYQIDRD